MTQDEKKFCLLHLISQELFIIRFYGTIYHMLLMVHLCKMMIFQGLFPFFKKKFKNLWDVKERESMIEGVKGKKFVQNEKKFCLSRPIPQEPYITWFLLMVLMCKMTIPPGVFLFFSKNFVCHAWYFRNYTSYDCHLQ